MRRLGYWIESLWDDRYFAPQEFVGAVDEQRKRLVLTYLRSGKVTVAHRGYSWCRFMCDASPEEMGCQELTDGQWAWPWSLSHYVDRHNVKLPEEFVEHILRGDGFLRSTHAQAGEMDPDFDDGWWSNWCAVHRSGALQGRLSEAQAEAERLWSVALRDAQNRLVEKNGISDKPCASSDCRERAMNGWNFCAACSVAAGSLQELNPPPRRLDIDHFLLTEALRPQR